MSIKLPPQNLADRVIGYFSPERAMSRMRARTMMSSGSGHTGASVLHRGLRSWVTSEASPASTIAADLKKLRQRSRDLVRNNPIATGAVSGVVLNVVGDGLVLQSQVDREVLGLEPEAADKWQAQAQREFALWSKRPDFTGRLNFDEMQALALRSVLEAGDMLVVRRRRLDAGDVYGLKLQFIEGERICNPNLRMNSATMVEGVVLDDDGRATGYSICSTYPDEYVSGRARAWKTYDIGGSITGTPQMLLLMHATRVDQPRGLPYLSAVISTLKQISDYTDAEIRAAVISAMFTVFVTRPEIENDNDPVLGESGEAGTDERTEVTLSSGAVIDLAPGEEPKFADPKRPNTSAQVFIEAMCKQVGMALDLPAEVLLKSFNASYSASRASLEMAWQFYRQRRSWLAWKFCQPCYEWVITEAIVAGRLQAPGFFDDPVIREAWLGSDWIGPSRIQLDPQKEAAADLVDLGMGTKTREQIITERTGGSFMAKHVQLVKEETMRREAGLVTPAAAGAAQSAQQDNGTGSNQPGGNP